jgi:SAM-dependent methyltransferase
MSGRPEVRRAIEYERWLGGASPSAVAMRWLTGSAATFLTNTAIFRLPEQLDLDPSMRLLDIGCGRGALTRLLSGRVRPQRAAVGVDLSSTALRLASADERARRPWMRTRLARGTAAALPFRDGAFTLVTCSYVVKHLSDIELRALLLEVRRVLEPGGLALLWEVGPSGHRKLDAWNARLLSIGSEPVRLRSVETLQRHATAAGFEFTRDARLRPFLFPPMPRASLLFGRPPEGWEGEL